MAMQLKTAILGSMLPGILLKLSEVVLNGMIGHGRDDLRVLTTRVLGLAIYGLKYVPASGSQLAVWQERAPFVRGD